MRHSGRRSRSAVLRALIENVQLGIPSASAASGGASAALADATQAVSRSNHELVAVGRNLNQVAKSLNAYPGKTTVADRMAIDQAVMAVQAHLPPASKLVAELLPLVRLKPAAEERQTAGARRASKQKAAP